MARFSKVISRVQLVRRIIIIVSTSDPAGVVQQPLEAGGRLKEESAQRPTDAPSCRGLWVDGSRFRVEARGDDRQFVRQGNMAGEGLFQRAGYELRQLRPGKRAEAIAIAWAKTFLAAFALVLLSMRFPHPSPPSPPSPPPPLLLRSQQGASTSHHTYRTQNENCTVITHTNIHTHTNTHKHIYTHTHIHTNIYIHTHTNLHTHIHRQTHKHTHTHTHAYKHAYTHTHTHTHTHKHKHTHRPMDHARKMKASPLLLGSANFPHAIVLNLAPPRPQVDGSLRP